MPHKPPINRHALRKKGFFDEERFYRLLSEHCGYIDPVVSKRFYLGLVKAVTGELRTRGLVRLPHLGDFALVWQKSKSGFSGRIGKEHTRTLLPPTRMIKFYPNDGWRKYFSILRDRV